VLVQLFIPGLAPVSLLESESEFDIIVTQIADAVKRQIPYL
jgi:hypothetical protein